MGWWNLIDGDNDSDDEHRIDLDDGDVEMLKYKPSELKGILTDDEIEEFKLKQLKYDQLVRQNSLERLKNKKVLTEHEKRLLRCTRIRFNRDGIMEFQQNVRISTTEFQRFLEWKFGGTFYKRDMYGDAVQVNDYPGSYISRHPTNWGFVMQSCWTIYTSFPMPLMNTMDDILINNDDSIIGYREMMQYNRLGMVRMKNKENKHDDADDEKLVNEQGMFDLEYLKAMRDKKDKKKRKGKKRRRNEMEEDDDVTMSNNHNNKRRRRR